MAAIILPIIPGFLPAFQAYIEFIQRPAHCSDPNDKIKIRGYQMLEKMRGDFLFTSLSVMAVHAIISIACESMKLLSTILWGGAILSLASAAVNVCLFLSANEERIRLQAIVDKTI